MMDQKQNDINEFLRKQRVEDVLIQLLDIHGIGEIMRILAEDNWESSENIPNPTKSLYHGRLAQALGSVRLVAMEEDNDRYQNSLRKEERGV